MNLRLERCPLRNATGKSDDELAKSCYRVGRGAGFRFTDFSLNGPVIGIFIGPQRSSVGLRFSPAEQEMTYSFSRLGGTWQRVLP